MGGSHGCMRFGTERWHVTHRVLGTAPSGPLDRTRTMEPSAHSSVGLLRCLAFAPLPTRVCYSFCCVHSCANAESSVANGPLLLLSQGLCAAGGARPGGGGGQLHWRLHLHLAGSGLPAAGGRAGAAQQRRWGSYTYTVLRRTHMSTRRSTDKWRVKCSASPSKSTERGESWHVIGPHKRHANTLRAGNWLPKIAKAGVLRCSPCHGSLPPSPRPRGPGIRHRRVEGCSGCRPPRPARPGGVRGVPGAVLVPGAGGAQHAQVGS